MASGFAAGSVMCVLSDTTIARPLQPKPDAASTMANSTHGDGMTSFKTTTERSNLPRVSHHAAPPIVRVSHRAAPPHVRPLRKATKRPPRRSQRRFHAMTSEQTSSNPHSRLRPSCRSLLQQTNDLATTKKPTCSYASHRATATLRKPSRHYYRKRTDQESCSFCTEAYYKTA